MPGMFTVFMLFLPAGLGVYMFTNSVLAITQQWAVERFSRKSSGTAGPGSIGVKEKGAPPKGALPEKNSKRGTGSREGPSNQIVTREGD
jgi:YidC/Oxa1 family membrane protein insertase